MRPKKKREKKEKEKKRKKIKIDKEIWHQYNKVGYTASPVACR